MATIVEDCSSDDQENERRKGWGKDEEEGSFDGRACDAASCGCVGGGGGAVVDVGGIRLLMNERT